MCLAKEYKGPASSRMSLEKAANGKDPSSVIPLQLMVELNQFGIMVAGMGIWQDFPRTSHSKSWSGDGEVYR